MPNKSAKPVRVIRSDPEDPFRHRGYESVHLCRPQILTLMSLMLDKQKVDVARRIVRKRCTFITTWSFQDPVHGNSFLIELSHGTVFGTRKLKINGQLIEKGRKLIDTGSSHEVVFDSRRIRVAISVQGVAFKYQLQVDGNTCELENANLKGEPLASPSPGAANSKAASASASASAAKSQRGPIFAEKETDDLLW